MFKKYVKTNMELEIIEQTKEVLAFAAKKLNVYFDEIY